jgi:hypothetical protein
MGSKYRDISGFTPHIGNEITLKHLEEALMSNFPYNSPAEAVLAEELAAVTEQKDKRKESTLIEKGKIRELKEKFKQKLP